jgi:hypothetical protein
MKVGRRLDDSRKEKWPQQGVTVLGPFHWGGPREEVTITYYQDENTAV